MNATRPKSVVVAAGYKYGTYVTDDALSVLDRHGTQADIDLRALDIGDHVEAVAALAGRPMRHVMSEVDVAVYGRRVGGRRS